MKFIRAILPLLLFLLLSQKTQLRADNQPVESSIENVTVFVAGAQVGRSASADLPAGRTELVFKGISPNIDPQSIQVKGGGAFTILSVIHQMNYREEQEKRKEIADLEVEKTQLLRQQKEEKALLAVFSQEQKMLEKNQSIGGANTGVNTAELRQALDLHRQRMTEVALKHLELQRNLATMDSTLQKINRQLAALHQEKETATSEILVNVSADAAVAAKFEITYYVADVGWFATYDFRVQDVSSPIDIAFKANVFQHSGEDWKEVNLKLSNGNPMENGVMRELRPWYLRYGRRGQAARPPGKLGSGGISSVSGKIYDADTGEPLIGATVLAKGTTIGTVTDIDGSYSMQIPASPIALVVSYIGYGNTAVPVNSYTHDVAIKASAANLSEVVVTGLGKKGLLSGIRIRGSRNDETNYYLDGIRVTGGTAPKQTIEQHNIETYQPTTVTFEIELPQLFQV